MGNRYNPSNIIVRNDLITVDDLGYMAALALQGNKTRNTKDYSVGQAVFLVLYDLDH
jgi:hypothetical protein